MDVQAWTYVIVTFTFILYIGVAIWSRASSTSEFYVAGKGVSPWPMEWPPRPIGCRRRRSFRWPG